MKVGETHKAVLTKKEVAQALHDFVCKRDRLIRRDGDEFNSEFAIHGTSDELDFVEFDITRIG